MDPNYIDSGQKITKKDVKLKSVTDNFLATKQPNAASNSFDLFCPASQKLRCYHNTISIVDVAELQAGMLWLFEHTSKSTIE